MSRSKNAQRLNTWLEKISNRHFINVRMHIFIRNTLVVRITIEVTDFGGAFWFFEFFANKIATVAKVFAVENVRRVQRPGEARNYGGLYVRDGRARLAWRRFHFRPRPYGTNEKRTFYGPRGLFLSAVCTGPIIIMNRKNTRLHTHTRTIL